MINSYVQWVSDQSFNKVDGVALGLTGLSMFQYLPYVSAGLAAVWWGLRIYVYVRDEVLKKKEKDIGHQ